MTQANQVNLSRVDEAFIASIAHGTESPTVCRHQPVQFLQGLPARLQYGFANDYRDRKEAEFDAWCVGIDARQAGRRCEVPALLADVPDLAQKWLEGWMFPAGWGLAE